MKELFLSEKLINKISKSKELSVDEEMLSKIM